RWDRSLHKTRDAHLESAAWAQRHHFLQREWGPTPIRSTLARSRTCARVGAAGAHAAGADRGDHFIRPETRTWNQRHGLSAIIFCSANGAPPPFARPSRAPEPALGSGPQALMPPAPIGAITS